MKIIENFEKDFSFSIPSLVITGGGSLNDHWMQIFADVTKRKIVTTNQPKLAGALGATMCVLVGSGVFKEFKSVKQIVLKSKEFIPDQKNFEVYDGLFKDYKNLYTSLKSSYEKSNAKRFA